MTRKMLMFAALGFTVVFLTSLLAYAAHTWMRLTPPRSPPILMLIKA
jgi:hypothetical protein